MILPTALPRLILVTILLSSIGRINAEQPLSPEQYRRDVVEARLRRSGPHPVEGLWLLTATDATKAIIAIERIGTDRFDAGSYRMIVVEAEDRSIVPGTIIGTLHATARANEFDTSLASDISTGFPARHKSYTLSLIDSGNRLTLSPRAGKYRINFYAAMPFLFVRPSITSRTGSQNNAPEHGAVRIFPRPSKPTVPVYL